MPQTDAQRRAKAKYNLKVYDRIELKVDKGRKSEIQSHAAVQGESLNGFVNRAIDTVIEQDNTKDGVSNA